MSEIKRFNCEAVDNSAVMEMFDPEGEYVLHSDHEAEIARLRAEVEHLTEALRCRTIDWNEACNSRESWTEKSKAARAEADALRDGLEAVYQYGSDTLRGPTGDTPDDRAWHRAAVLEMTNRASRTITTGSWKKDGDAAMGASA